MHIVAHVDDFLVLGTEAELRSLLQDLQKDYECDGQFLGVGAGCQSELKFLGRTIRLTDAGLELEGDKKHALAFVGKMSELFCEKQSRVRNKHTDRGVELLANSGRDDGELTSNRAAKAWNTQAGGCIMSFAESAGAVGEASASG